ncbi:acetylcholinesterase collagenic tail peptide-like [Stylophora pistillata]|uniref:acetylcholinesterase collagenic tail peptide-like n=1 Tax=Stylophora pistillata TaxID=50429 RepID=UPI000C053A03|nr:acetylcholinesterase collagenic tail peptide-like [Stylophora pistillata]
MRGARGPQGRDGPRGRRGRPGYIGKAGKRGPPGARGRQGPRGRPGSALAGNTSRLLQDIDIPRIKKKPPTSMTVKEDSNVSLPCYSKGFPKPEVTWFKNGQKMNSRKYNKDTGMLTFPSIHFNDRGLYRCEARNFIGVESATVKIVVEGIEN